MKLVIVLIAISFLGSLGLKPEWNNDWKDFKALHGKKYKNPSEETRRREIYENKRNLIDKHNKEAKQGLHSYSMGVNEFTDKSNEELEALVPLLQIVKIERPQDATELRQLPVSYDMRSSSCMAPIKKQGSCNSCWAFTAINPIEYNLCFKTGTSKVLSEQQLVNCTMGGALGCNPGSFFPAWNYIMDFGIATQTDYPYVGQNGSCTYNRANSVGTIAYYSLVRSNVTFIQSALVNKGPLATYFHVVNNFFSYSSGIYSDSTCSSDGTTANHAVVIVGYGSSNSGIPFWIARNSYGTTWGLLGYFRVRRGVNMCNIESAPYSVTV